MPPSVATRQETDSFGAIAVPADRLWGAQTQRSLREFPHRRRTHAAGRHSRARPGQAGGGGDQRRTRPAARPTIAAAIAARGAEVVDGRARRRIPPQGLADRLGHADQHERQRGDRQPRQRAARRASAATRRRSIPTIMSISANPRTIPSRPRCTSPRRWSSIAACSPALTRLGAALDEKSAAFADIVKIGRTHLQDATPIRSARSSPARRRRSNWAIARVEATLPRLLALAQGGTAVGTGLNTHPRLCRALRRARSPRSPACPSSRPPTSSRRSPRMTRWSNCSGALNALAAALIKIANDIRLLGSGPRCGLGEIEPAGERAGLLDHAGQGQSDADRGADAWCARRTIGNDDHRRLRRQPGPSRTQRVQAADHQRNAAIDRGCSADAVDSFADDCVAGIEPNRERIAGAAGALADAGDGADAGRSATTSAAADRQGGPSQRHDACAKRRSRPALTPRPSTGWFAPKPWSDQAELVAFVAGPGRLAQAREARCAAGPFALARLRAVLISARCEKACGKLPSRRRVARIVFLRQQPTSLRSASRRSNRRPRLFYAPRQHVIVGEPEAAGEERAFARRQAVGSRSRVVAQAPVRRAAARARSRRPCLARADRRAAGSRPSGISSRLASSASRRNIARRCSAVRRSRARKLPHGSSSRTSRQRSSGPVEAELLDRSHGAIEGDPGHHLGMGEVLAAAPHFPDPLVGLRAKSSRDGRAARIRAPSSRRSPPARRAARRKRRRALRHRRRAGAGRPRRCRSGPAAAPS